MLAVSRNVQPEPASIQNTRFGSLGVAAYERNAPCAPNYSRYAIDKIDEKFTDSDSTGINAARVQMWSSFDDLCNAVRSGESRDTVALVKQLVCDRSSLAHTQHASVPKIGLAAHLEEVAVYSESLVLKEDRTSRFPDLLSDREAQLLTYVVAPLHDLLKYLGKPEAQIMPDHEVMAAELVRLTFVGRSVRLGGEETLLTHQDVDFVAAVIGDHENIEKEAGRADFISSASSSERAKSIFFVVDVLTNVFRPTEKSATWTIDVKALHDRFTDLYVRHIDPVLGKIFRPSWAVHTIEALNNTLSAFERSGITIHGTHDETWRVPLISAALDGINECRLLDLDRVIAQSKGETVDKFLTEPMRIEISTAHTQLCKMLDEIVWRLYD